VILYSHTILAGLAFGIADVCLRILLLQELRRIGILNMDEENAQDEPNLVSCDVPVEPSAPLFVIRPGRLRGRRSALRALPLYLSLSSLSDDINIARLMSSPTHVSHSTIQRRPASRPAPINTDLPPSLPGTPTISSALVDHTVSSPTSFDLNTGDWTLVGTSQHSTASSTPVSEPRDLDSPERRLVADLLH